MLNNLPEEMKNLENFLLWKLIPADPKPKKVPHHPFKHYQCSAVKDENYVTYYQAIEQIKKHPQFGLGFCLTTINGITCIDFDNCLDDYRNVLQEYEETVLHLVDDFNSYVEVSQSGKGLHIFIYGVPKGTRTRRADAPFPVEVYGHSRFIAVTGDIWNGYNTIRNAQDILDSLYNSLFEEKKAVCNEQVSSNDQGVATPCSDISDERILQIMGNSKNADKFNALFKNGGNSDDRSADDMALANMVAFYTQDMEQIIRIMRQSSLVREKWERKSYLESTAKRAISGVTAKFDWAEADKKNQEWQENNKNKKQYSDDAVPPLQLELPESLQLEKPVNLPIFWTESEDKKSGKKIVKISDALLMEFFKVTGYRKLPTSTDNKTDIVLIDSCFMEHTGSQDIVSVLVKYTQKEEFKHIHEELASLIPKLNQSLNVIYWRILDKVIPKTNLDTVKKGYHFFKNGIVNVSEKETQITSYENFKGVVWKHQINNRDFVPCNIKGEFETFCENTQREKDGNINPMRWSAFKSFFGYALHKYHNPSNARACIIQDEAVRQYKSEANGGTGKSIIAKAIQILRPGFYLDCKMADFKKDAFIYDGAKPDDQSLVFDDVKNNFPFEFIYNQVERPAMINAKGRNKIPFDNVPKYIITSNSIIDVDSESSKRRIAMIFCGAHYSIKHTPMMEFGHNLFADWADDQWQAFYNFALECVRFYLINGLVHFEPESYAKRKTIEKYGIDAYLWMKENIVSTGGEQPQRLETDLMLQNFILYTGLNKTTKTELTKKILDYGKNEGISVEVVSIHSKRYYSITGHTSGTLF